MNLRCPGCSFPAGDHNPGKKPKIACEDCGIVFSVRFLAPADLPQKSQVTYKTSALEIRDVKIERVT